jgi:diaminohydroxyphosphoribosylaminopyrimidine deaminase/5-amino-6-(5-phosphoribosylamino)uracil reductase
MTDEHYIQRCLDLAQKGLAAVSPNPMVGCVIVHDNKIIGEGYHQKYGEPHAEVNAVSDTFKTYGEAANMLLKAATAYVSLEPCAHFGKTPPCADLLIKHKLKRVVICNTDPFEQVNGSGIEKLRAAGIEVKIHVLSELGHFINRRFFTRIKQQRPFIIIKFAQTMNGYFAPLGGNQKWITGNAAKQLVHQWRGEEDAILVGKNTALIDNPQLTNRTETGKNPIRIIIDRNLTIPQSHHVFNHEVKTIIFNEIKTEVSGKNHYVQMEDMQYYLAQKIAYQLYLMDIQSVIIEGGVQLINEFVKADLWDEARVFTGNVSWDDGIKAPLLTGNTIEELNIGSDKLTIFSNKKYDFFNT